jgi:hypothetical protein
MQVKTIADFLKVLPDATSRATLLNPAISVKQSSNKRTGTQTDKRVTVQSSTTTTDVTSPSSPRNVIYDAGPSTSYATPKRVVETEDEGDDDDQYIDEEVKSYGARHFGTPASPYLTPYLYDKGFLDKQYGLRKEDGNFMVGDSNVSVDKDGDLYIKGQHFRGTSGLWKPLTRKRINKEKVTTSDLKTYKNILQMTHGHLEGYEPGANIQISRGPKFRKFIAKLFPQS